MHLSRNAETIEEDARATPMNLNKLIEYFVPDTLLATQDDEQFNGRTVVIVSLSVVCIVLIFLANRIRLNGLFSFQSITLFLAAIAIFAVPVAMKLTGRIKKPTVALIIIFMLLIMVFTASTGGPYSPSLVFTPAVPLAGILFISYRFGVAIAICLILHLMILAWAHRMGILPEVTISESASAMLQIGCAIAVTVIFSILAITHIDWQQSMREKLERASEAKSQFLSGMSHELRTPLNSITGFSDMLAKGYTGKLTSKQKEYIDNILRSSSHMLDLVNDLLDIAKIESGKTEVEFEKVKIEPLVAECLDMMSDTAAKKSVAMDPCLHEQVADLHAFLDAIKIKQILLNLLSNAVKFSPEGGTITLRVETTCSQLVIEVEDQGPGVADQDAEKVFEKFYQVRQQNNNKTPGTGLGLAISRHFAEIHGGTLFLKTPSQPIGAVFRLEIPLVKSKASETETADIAINAQVDSNEELVFKTGS